MGLLRLYLAVCVVATHAGPVFLWPAHDAHQAVQIFFLISGFYMSMVFGTKYKNARQFYASRFFRIYMPYAIILTATFALGLLSRMMSWNWLWGELQPYFSSPFDRNGVAGVVIAAASNLTIFFQDWVMFLQQDAGEPLQFTSDFRNSDSPLYQYLLVPQAWSIGLELTFYLLVPLLARLSSRTLVLIAFASLIARILAYELLNFDRDPWEYRFFPFEISTFIVGMLSYRLFRALPYHRLTVRPSTVSAYAVGCIGLVALFIASAVAVEKLSAVMGHGYAVLVFYGIWAFLLPALFQIFGLSSLDRFIGELSYPVYLSHLLLLSPIAAVVGRAAMPKWTLGPMVAAFSIAFSAVLYVLVLAPLEGWRHDFVRRMNRSAQA